MIFSDWLSDEFIWTDLSFQLIRIIDVLLYIYHLIQSYYMLSFGNYTISQYLIRIEKINRKYTIKFICIKWMYVRMYDFKIYIYLYNFDSFLVKTFLIKKKKKNKWIVGRTIKIIIHRIIFLFKFLWCTFTFNFLHWNERILFLHFQFIFACEMPFLFVFLSNLYLYYI